MYTLAELLAGGRLYFSESNDDKLSLSELNSTRTLANLLVGGKLTFWYQMKHTLVELRARGKTPNKDTNCKKKTPRQRKTKIFLIKLGDFGAPIKKQKGDH